MCSLCDAATEAETQSKADNCDAIRDYILWCVENNETPYIEAIAGILGINYNGGN